MRKYLAFLLLSCFTISCTQQENINDLIKKAEQGDVEAQYIIWDIMIIVEKA